MEDSAGPLYSKLAKVGLTEDCFLVASPSSVNLPPRILAVECYDTRILENKRSLRITSNININLEDPQYL